MNWTQFLFGQKWTGILKREWGKERGVSKGSVELGMGKNNKGLVPVNVIRSAVSASWQLLKLRCYLPTETWRWKSYPSKFNFKGMVFRSLGKIPKSRKRCIYISKEQKKKIQNCKLFLVNTLRKWDQLWARTYSKILAALSHPRYWAVRNCDNICLSLLMCVCTGVGGVDRQNHLYGKSVVLIGQDEVYLRRLRGTWLRFDQRTFISIKKIALHSRINMEYQQIPNSQNYLKKKKDKVEGLILPDSKSYSKSTIIKRVWY